MSFHSKNLSMLHKSSVLLFSLLSSILFFQCKSPERALAEDGVRELLQCVPKIQEVPQHSIQKIAFGSCMHQNQPLEVLKQVVAAQPELFVFLGDNLYGDTENMKLLAAKYSKLCQREEFKQLAATCPIIATWDDHDYGANDSGREYPMKKASRELFLEFWNDPKGSARSKSPGIYTQYHIGPKGQRLQIIVLDTRSFRSPLLKNNNPKKYRNSYRPNDNSNATILGDAQWKWLAKVLKEPADLRLICSSTQFGISYNGYEAWANFPKEREKFLELIKTQKANGVIFISGDVHYGELSKIEHPGLYPIYDCTSSGINQDWPHVEANSNRVGEACTFYNFGLLEIDWEAKHLTFKIINDRKKLHLEHKVPFSELQLKG